MNSSNYDNHNTHDESKRNEALDKFVGMKWKRNQNPKSYSKKNIEEPLAVDSSSDGGNKQDQIIKSRNNLSKYRFQVFIRETFPYIDEVPESEVLNDSDSSLEKPTKSFEENNFFKNIDPKDKNAFAFYRPEKIAAARVKEKENSSPTTEKQANSSHSKTPVCNSFRKPWIGLLGSNSSRTKVCDVLEGQLKSTESELSSLSVDNVSTHRLTDHRNSNPQLTSMKPYCNNTDVPENTVECREVTTNLLNQQVVCENLIPKRKPGTGIRLNCKRSAVPLDELPVPLGESAVPQDKSEQVQHNIFTDNEKNLHQDIEILLNHIDAARLNNLSRIIDKKRNTSANEFQNKYLSSENLNENCDLSTSGEFCGKQKDICFLSSAISSTPTAKVQPSVMINKSHILPNQQSLRINPTQNIVSESKLLELNTNYQAVRTNNEVSYLPAFMEKQISTNSINNLEMTNNFSAPVSYTQQDNNLTPQNSTSTCFNPAIPANNQQQLSYPASSLQSHASQSFLPVHTSKITTMENGSTIYGNNLIQEDLISQTPLQSQNQMLASAHDMIQQQNLQRHASQSFLPAHTSRITTMENGSKMYGNNLLQEDLISQTPLQSQNQMLSSAHDMIQQQNHMSQFSQYPITIGSHGILQSLNQIAINSNMSM